MVFQRLLFYLLAELCLWRVRWRGQGSSIWSWRRIDGHTPRMVMDRGSATYVHNKVDRTVFCEPTPCRSSRFNAGTGQLAHVRVGLKACFAFRRISEVTNGMCALDHFRLQAWCGGPGPPRQAPSGDTVRRTSSVCASPSAHSYPVWRLWPLLKCDQIWYVCSEGVAV